MGGSNSHVLTTFDVARVREWLLIALQGRFRIENARKATPSASSSIHSFLLQTFQRYEAVLLALTASNSVDGQESLSERMWGLCCVHRHQADVLSARLRS